MKYALNCVFNCLGQFPEWFAVQRDLRENIADIGGGYLFKILEAWGNKNSSEIYGCRTNQQLLCAFSKVLIWPMQPSREKMDSPVSVAEIANQIYHRFRFFWLHRTENVVNGFY